MNCKCKECKHYQQKTDITGHCKIKNYVTVSNATCNSSEKVKENENPILEFLQGFGK